MSTKLPDGFVIRKPPKNHTVSIWGPRGEVIERVSSTKIGFKPLKVPPRNGEIG